MSLHDGPAGLGRGPGSRQTNQLPIPSQYVSGDHARLEAHGGRVYLHQCYATVNDTLVNGCQATLGELYPLRTDDLFFLDTEGFLVREVHY